MYEDIESCIRGENDTTRSLDDQVKVADWLYDHDVTETEDELLRRKEIDSHVDLEYQTKTVLENLEEINIVEKKKPGSDRFIHHERTGKFLHGAPRSDVARLLRADLKRFIQDVREQDEPLEDGSANDDDEDLEPTLRDVAAEALGIEPGDLEGFLQEPTDPIEQMNRYDKAVQAVKEADEVSVTKEYDRMGWRNTANRWTLSSYAVRLEENERLPLEGGVEDR